MQFILVIFGTSNNSGKKAPALGAGWRRDVADVQ